MAVLRHMQRRRVLLATMWPYNNFNVLVELHKEAEKAHLPIAPKRTIPNACEAKPGVKV